MQCEKCGAELNDGVKFCRKCGAEVEPNTKVDIVLNSGEGNEAGWTLFGEEIRTDENGYVLPQGNSEYLSTYDISDFSELELTIARNEIYARKGQVFTKKNAEAQKYFNMMPWYKNIKNKKGGNLKLNELEVYNVKLILDYADRHFGRNSYFAEP